MFNAETNRHFAALMLAGGSKLQNYAYPAQTVIQLRAAEEGHATQ